LRVDGAGVGEFGDVFERDFGVNFENKKNGKILATIENCGDLLRGEVVFYIQLLKNWRKNCV
jgi:hypothetical protein